MTTTSDTPNNGDGEVKLPNHETERTVFSAEINQEVTAAVLQLSETNPAIGQLLKSSGGEEAVKEMATVAISVVREHHSGPTPSGSQLREYDAIFPNGADRLFSTVENEQNHRQAMEKNILALNQQNLQFQQEILIAELKLKAKSLDVVEKRDARGQFFAGGLSLVVLGIGSWLIHLGHPGFGVTLIGGNLMGIAAVFLSQKIKRAEPKDQSKAEATPE